MVYELKQIQDICDTVDWLYDLLIGYGYNYEQAKQAIITGDDNYTTDITYDSDDFFDCRVGDMVFTIHKDDDDGFRVDDIAYYIVDELESNERITIHL